VCSTFRPDACPQARALRGKAWALGVRVEVQPEVLGHMEINRSPGIEPACPRCVSAFIESLLR